MDYYDMKNQATWEVIGMVVKCSILLLLFLWMLHSCVGAIEHQGEPKGDLNAEHRARIIHNMTEFEKEQHLDLADKCLTAKVEREWRETK